MSEKKKGNSVVGFVVLAVLGFSLYSCLGNSKDSPEIAAEKRAKATEDKRKGFHCLSAWDGSHDNFKDAVKEMMREPSSLEHIETRVGPVSADGTHSLMMKYRARNGFGGMNVGTALGGYRNDDCSFKVLTVE